MQTFSTWFSFRSSLVRAFGLLALVCLLAACDRHSATEVPESYGHGSSHAKSFTDHQVDSRNDSKSFSDTQGVVVEKEKGEGVEPPAASASGEKPANQFFPKGN